MKEGVVSVPSGGRCPITVTRGRAPEHHSEHHHGAQNWHSGISATKGRILTFTNKLSETGKNVGLYSFSPNLRFELSNIGRMR